MDPAASVEQAKTLLRERATLLQSPEYNSNSDVVCAIDSQVCNDEQAVDWLKAKANITAWLLYISDAGYAPLVSGLCSTLQRC